MHRASSTSPSCAPLRRTAAVERIALRLKTPEILSLLVDVELGLLCPPQPRRPRSTPYRAWCGSRSRAPSLAAPTSTRPARRASRRAVNRARPCKQSKPKLTAERSTQLRCARARSINESDSSAAVPRASWRALDALGDTNDASLRLFATLRALARHQRHTLVFERRGTHITATDRTRSRRHRA